MHDVLVILVILAVCVGLSLLLAAPVIALRRWRRRRRGLDVVAPEVKLTFWGWAFEVAQCLAIFVAIFVAQRTPQSLLGRLAEGPLGMWRVGILGLMIFSAVATLARRSGIVLHRPATGTPPTSPGAPVIANAQIAEKWLLKMRLGTGPALRVHASFVFTGAAVSLVLGWDVREALGCWVACMLIYALHESGHALVARRRGLKVHTIELTARGGLCRIQLLRAVDDTAWVFAAGLLAQLALLCITLLAAAVAGIPSSSYGYGLFLGFTVANAIILVINLVPGRTAQGLKTDGAVLWELWRHVRVGTPHPLAAHHEASALFPPDTRLLDIDGMAPPDFTTGIEILNDDATPMEFVCDALTRCVGLAQDVAIAAMLEIHRRGGKLFPTADLPQAEAIAGAISRAAREAGHPLVCRAVDVASA